MKITSYADKDSEKGVNPFISQNITVKFLTVPTDAACLEESSLFKTRSLLSSKSLLEDLVDTEILLMIDDLGSELDLNNLTAIVMKILESENQVILTGIEGEEMHKSLKKMTNFTQINI